MKIDDIPLPPSIPGKSSRNDENNNFNVSNSHNVNNHSLPLKRIVNHKLPVGLIQKKEYIKKNDSVTSRRELFLPSINDKMQLAINNLNNLERVSMTVSIEKTNAVRTEIIKPINDSKINTISRRRSNDEDVKYLVKRCRMDDHRRDRWDENIVNRVKSQVLVRDRGNSDLREHSRQTKIHDQTYSRERRHHGHYSPRDRRSPLRRRERHSSHRDHHFTARNGKYRNRDNDATSSHRHADPHIVSITDKRSCSQSSKKSLFATSTCHSSSPSLITTCNMDLPLDSPKSPEDSPSHSLKKELLVVDTTTNLYLKNLKDTLDRINVAYKSVFSKIPDPKIRLEDEICNIPLPSSAPEELRPNGIHTDNNVHKSSIGNCNEFCNANITEPCLIKPGARSNSINADKLSSISSATMGSNAPRSPLFSVNISSYSKESENSETKFRPAIPKIINFHIDYSEVDHPLLKNSLQDLLSNTIKCHCTMPNPDQWNDDGIRACGRSQGCLLSQLRVECSNNRCPNEVLCCNRQFQELDSSSSHYGNVELFFDMNQAWKLRTKRSTQKHKLLFEVSGRAIATGQLSEALSEIRITKDVALSLKSDQQSFIYYLKQGSREEANVKIEKWLVDGHIRVGVFALCEVAPKTELAMFYSPSVLDEPQSLDNEDGLRSTIRSLVHDSPDEYGLEALVDQLLSSHHPPWVLDHFLREGGLALMCSSVLRLLPHRGVLQTKLMDLLDVAPLDKASVSSILGLDLRDLLGLLVSSDSSCGRLEQTRAKLDRLSKKDPCKAGMRANDANSTTLYTLNCRLPTFWCSRECVSNAEARVFFYHRITKSVQWDMPVYPWESNEDDEADIYDYNHASTTPVTHHEISQMYLNLNKMYEIKQRRILHKETNTRHPKQFSDAHKKEQFRKKIMEFIVRLLRPYRSGACQVGRITCDDDLRYLANKLTQTILFKELKILNNAAELLQVSTVVETKTKTYVRTYLQSRGTTYRRPSNPTEIIRKEAAQGTVFLN